MEAIQSIDTYRRLKGYNVGPWNGMAFLVAMSLAVLGLMVLRRNPSLSFALWVATGIWMVGTFVSEEQPWSIATLLAKEMSWMTRRRVSWVNANLLGADSKVSMPGKLSQVKWTQTPTGVGVLKAGKRDWTAHLVAEAAGTPEEVLAGITDAARRLIDQVGWTNHIHHITWIVNYRPHVAREVPARPTTNGIASDLLRGSESELAAKTGKTTIRAAVTFDPLVGPAAQSDDNARLQAIDLDLGVISEAMRSLRLAPTPATVPDLIVWLRDRFDPLSAPYQLDGPPDLSEAVGFSVREERGWLALGAASSVGFMMRQPPSPALASEIFNTVRQFSGLNVTLALTMRPQTGAAAHRTLQANRNGSVMRQSVARRSAVAEVDVVQSEAQALSVATGETLVKFGVTGAVTLDPNRPGVVAAGLVNDLGNGNMRVTVAHGFHLATFIDTLGVGIPVLKSLGHR